MTLPRPSHSGPREWDADVYDAVSDPQLAWGVEVLDRIPLRGDETAIDAGCGSGRVTAELVRRLPRGRVMAVDGSEAMIEKARARLGDAAEFIVADLLELELPERADLVFSTATFHWILDHRRLFARMRACLQPGGHLVAQCGGSGNVAGFARAIAAVEARAEFSDHLRGREPIWNFAEPGETEALLRAAGFDRASCWLEPKPVRPERPVEFVSAAGLGPHLAMLPEALRRPFAEAVVAEAGTPFTLDFVRLNIEAQVGP